MSSVKIIAQVTRDGGATITFSAPSEQRVLAIPDEAIKAWGKDMGHEDEYAELVKDIRENFRLKLTNVIDHLSVNFELAHGYDADGDGSEWKQSEGGLYITGEPMHGLAAIGTIDNIRGGFVPGKLAP